MVKFHYYTQDYLGNNRAVINGSTGAIEQTVAYYPWGGVIADLGMNLSKQPYKFGGKELLTANGLNEYDFGARRYYSAVPHFTSPDPLCEQYYPLSPYLYCGNNPVNLIDKNGEEPSNYEAAIMAGYVYFDKDFQYYQDCLNETGWVKSSKQTSIKMNFTQFGENGLQSMLFERTIDGVTEYAYVFVGTDSLEDILEDVAQLAGVAPQYSCAIANAKTLSSELGNAELTFVGHSKVGGEAAAASMATDRVAITFNRASVSKLTKVFNDLGSPRNIKNVITQSLNSSGGYSMEPLSRIQNINVLGIKVMPSMGRTEFIKVNNKLSFKDAHAIKTVVDYYKNL